MKFVPVLENEALKESSSLLRLSSLLMGNGRTSQDSTDTEQSSKAKGFNSLPNALRISQPGVSSDSRRLNEF